jgi:hypothetical protein
VHDPAATTKSAASAFSRPGTICKPDHSASPNAGTSITNTGMPSVLDPEKRGSYVPLAGPNLRYASSPPMKTTNAVPKVTASVTPVSRSLIGTSAAAGTRAIESATE